jgi:hypothetical protein
MLQIGGDALPAVVLGMYKPWDEALADAHTFLSCTTHRLLASWLHPENVATVFVSSTATASWGWCRCQALS